jgi:predicted secreted protein
MNPETGVIILAIIQVLCLAALIVAALVLMASGRGAAGRLQPVVGPALRLKQLGTRMAATARGKSQQIAAVAQTLAEHLAQKWRTTTRIVHEVAHPDGLPTAELTEKIERGRSFTERLARLRDAARKAASHNGSHRTPA